MEIIKYFSEKFGVGDYVLLQLWVVRSLRIVLEFDIVILDNDLMVEVGFRRVFGKVVQRISSLYLFVVGDSEGIFGVFFGNVVFGDLSEVVFQDCLFDFVNYCLWYLKYNLFFGKFFKFRFIFF